MRLRPFLPAATIGLACLAAVLIWNYSSTFKRAGASEEGFTISGRVTAGPGPDALKGVQVRVRWMEDGVVRTVAVPVAADGTFSADRLLPGTYNLSATAATADGGAASPPPPAKAITISNANVSGVLLNLTATGGNK
jgi:hypothetical protein